MDEGANAYYGPPGSPSPPPIDHRGGGGRCSWSRDRGDAARRPPPANDAGNASDHQADYDARARINRIQYARHENYHGPKCFGPAIKAEKIPVGFKLSPNVKSYDGVAKPDTWLQDYFEAVDIAGGTNNTAVRYLPLMLTGTARAWIDGLPELSINNWLDM